MWWLKVSMNTKTWSVPLWPKGQHSYSLKNSLRTCEHLLNKVKSRPRRVTQRLAVTLVDIALLLWLPPTHGNWTRTRRFEETDENTAPIGTDGLDYGNHHETGPFRSPRGAVCLLFLDNSHPPRMLVHIETPPVQILLPHGHPPPAFKKKTRTVNTVRRSGIQEAPRATCSNKQDRVCRFVNMIGARWMRFAGMYSERSTWKRHRWNNARGQGVGFN